MMIYAYLAGSENAGIDHSIVITTPLNPIKSLHKVSASVVMISTTS